MDWIKRHTVALLRALGVLKLLISASQHVKARSAPPRAIDVVDGVPVPDARRIIAVNGNADVDAFLESGRKAAETVTDTLGRNGTPVPSLQALLDFGCGCGRVTRYWKDLGGGHTEVFGTDYNADLVGWCRHNLTFATFDTNDLRPPLRYPDDRFDLVYAFSVFTHLPEDLQRRWLDELLRVVRPGGHVLFSVHGDFYIPSLTPEEQRAFKAGQLVVRYDAAAGTNLCAAFHPRPYLTERLLAGLTLIDMVPEGAQGNPRQDLYFVRKN